MKRFAAVVIVVAAALAVAGNAIAQQPVEYKVMVKGEVVKGSPADHFLTFSGPVQIPEVTLAAGTYIFSVIGSSLVQVTNADRTLQYAMFFTAPVQREDAADDYEVAIVPTIATAPGRITKWYLPNQTRGFEFLYPEAARGDR